MTDDDDQPLKTFSRFLIGTYAGTESLVTNWLNESYAETDREIAEWVRSHRSRGGRLPDYEITTSFAQVPRPHGTPGLVMERVVKIVRRSDRVTMLKSVDAAVDED